ncbi:hypothetical protein CLOSPI_01469 [Thomasclavelia spiroformis DSM 1552]|uniref:Uncharacterized protein n=1 Tax=Thomasclavelia spiroformis DSM 1552 TaxID=428126 RepID=B1C2K7_9FIRM|nr:hypothetical protein CLOSPI_01469 [Thomasclavelia spiroformis DSM 1552]
MVIITADCIPYTELIKFPFVDVSNPNCCAILGTSASANNIPSPNSNSVYKNAVKHFAIVCSHHDMKPSVNPLGTLNIYKLATATWISNIPPCFKFAKNTLMTQYPIMMIMTWVISIPILRFMMISCALFDISPISPPINEVIPPVICVCNDMQNLYNSTGTVHLSSSVFVSLTIRTKR